MEPAMSTPTPRETLIRARDELLEAADLFEAHRVSPEYLDEKIKQLDAARVAFEARPEAKKELERAIRADALGSPSNGNTIGAMLASKGFNLKTCPSVELPATQVLAKANVWPSSNDMAPLRTNGITPMAHDSRWLWPLLTRQDAG